MHALCTHLCSSNYVFASLLLFGLVLHSSSKYVDPRNPTQAFKCVDNSSCLPYSSKQPSRVEYIENGFKLHHNLTLQNNVGEHQVEFVH